MFSTPPDGARKDCNGMAIYQVTSGRVKVQVEDMLGTRPTGGWVYQAPGQGNAGAEGAHYYYRSQTAEGSHKTAPADGRFGFDINVADAGTYSILVRAARDTNTPGDARNDIWIRIDGDTQDVMPAGTKGLTDGGGGFVKFKGGLSSKWGDLKVFSTPTHGDKNPWSDVVFDKGIHNITFAPRSTGLHIDSVLIVRKDGGVVPPRPEPEPEPEPEFPTMSTLTARIATRNDDFESNKAGASGDLEFGRDGAGAQSVGLRFEGLEVEAGAEIESAHFVFTAAETSSGAADFDIEIEATTAALTYSKLALPNSRSYLAETVDWAPGNWTKGGEYRSSDVSSLIEAVIAEDGLDALDALAFRISGSGMRSATAFESGIAPELVVTWV
jgi:hypothetical protein